MPVQFKCTQCKKTLKITRRKIGAEVACPLCGAKLIVPATDEAGAAGEEAHALPDDAPPKAEPAKAQPSKAEPAKPATTAAKGMPAPAAPNSTATADEEEYEDDDELLDEFIVYDGPQPAKPASAPPAAGATPAPAVASSSQNVSVPLRVGSVHVPPGTVLIPRWSLFVMTFLLFAAAGGAFWTGYTIGRAEGPLPGEESGGPAAELLVEGRVIYQPRPAETMGDVGAIVILLPQDADPSPKLDYGGLRPDEVAARGFNQGSLAAVRAIGGNVIDTDREGTYLSTLRKKGKYFQLIISRYTERKPGVNVDPEQAAILDRYFTDSQLLIGAKKYSLRLQSPDGPRQPVTSFGTTRE
jgi:DNA-directed RNA polymerase subunit RPC12/RpoP